MSSLSTVAEAPETMSEGQALLSNRLEEMVERGLMSRGDRHHLSALIHAAAGKIAADQEVKGRRLTEERADAFLLALSSGLSVSAAAALAGIARRTVYDLRAKDAEFSRRWDDALDMSVGAIEERFVEIALTGDPANMATVRAGEAILRGRSRGHRREQTQFAVHGKGTRGPATIVIRGTEVAIPD